MKIRESDNPEQFQRLVHALFVAEHGTDFQVVDDSGGDLGNDGYVRSQKTLLAIYCPEKKLDPTRVRQKIREDLDKAQRLVANHDYSIATWMFVTPLDLRENLQRFVRDEGATRGLAGICIGHRHLEEMFLRHRHIHDRFPDYAMPIILEKLDDIKEHLRAQDLEASRDLEVESVESVPNTTPSLYAMTGKLIPTPNIVRSLVEFEHGNRDEALSLLETLRLESDDPAEQLMAILLLIENIDRTADRDRCLVLADAGIGLAEQSEETGARAVLMATKAWIRSLESTLLDTNSYFLGQMELMIGIPTVGEAQREKTISEIAAWQDEADALFGKARQLCMEQDWLRELSIVLQAHGSALSLRHLLHRQVSGLEMQARRQLCMIRWLYDNSIRIAAVTGDTFMLARAYFNYANDLRTLGALEDAKLKLDRAESISREGAIHFILERVPTLRSRLEEPADAGAPEGEW